MSKRLFSIEEIRNYLLSQESRGDIMYYLSEANIIKANQPSIKCSTCGCKNSKCEKFEDGSCDCSECAC